MSRRSFSGDPVGDQKIALERLIRKTQDALDGMRGLGLNAAGNAGSTPQYGTGYNFGTGETVTIAMWDLSLFDGDDVYSD